MRKTRVSALIITCLAPLMLTACLDQRLDFTGNYPSSTLRTFVTLEGNALPPGLKTADVAVTLSEDDPRRIVINTDCPFTARVQGEGFFVDPASCPETHTDGCSSITTTIDTGAGACEAKNMYITVQGTLHQVCGGTPSSGTFLLTIAGIRVSNRK